MNHEEMYIDIDFARKFNNGFSISISDKIRF